MKRFPLLILLVLALGACASQGPMAPEAMRNLCMSPVTEGMDDYCSDQDKLCAGYFALTEAPYASALECRRACGNTYLTFQAGSAMYPVCANANDQGYGFCTMWCNRNYPDPDLKAGQP